MIFSFEKGMMQKEKYRKETEENKMKTDGILFDLDGTLWDAVEGILEAWNQVIAAHSDLRGPLEYSELQGYMGLPMDEIARRMFPMCPETQQQRLLEECCQVEHEVLEKRGGKLYPQVEETLQVLSRKFPLFIVSNCEDGYIQCFFRSMGLEKYFKDIECFGATGLSKGENNKLITRRNGLKQPVYVGDTQGDSHAARQAGIPFVFARYGFGDTKDYDTAIDHFAQLVELMEKI